MTHGHLSPSLSTLKRKVKVTSTEPRRGQYKWQAEEMKLKAF